MIFTKITPGWALRFFELALMLVLSITHSLGGRVAPHELVNGHVKNTFYADAFLAYKVISVSLRDRLPSQTPRRTLATASD